MSRSRQAILWTVAAVVVIAAVTTAPHPRKNPINIDKAAAETTQAAGKHFTKGVLEALKEATK